MTGPFWSDSLATDIPGLKIKSIRRIIAMPRSTSSSPIRKRKGASSAPRTASANDLSNRQCCREISGKTIAYLRYVNSKDWQELEIHFTDQTFLSLEFGFHLQIKAEHLKFSEGKLEKIRNYGILQGEQPFEEEVQ